MTAWLAGWGYRKSHVITHAANSGTKYQVKILVHSGSGVSSNSDVYLGGRCSSFPNDIDFTDDSGNAQLDFWIEDPTVDPITVWVEVAADLTADDRTIYIYYGKSGQSSLSNGDNTFLFFDHFPNSSLDANKWLLTYRPNSVTVSDSVAHIAGTEAAWKWISGLVAVGPYNIRVKHRSKIYDMTHYEMVGIGQAAAMGGGMAQHYGTRETSDYYYYQDTALGYRFGHLPSLDNAWHVDMIEWTNGWCKYYINGTLDVTEGSYFPVVSARAFIAVNATGGGTAQVDCDWIFLSKFVSPEPANTTWGSEEGSSTLAGITRDSSGNVLGNCTVYVFKTSDQLLLGSGTSDGNGNYSITIGAGPGTIVFAVAFKSGSPDVMGVTDNNITTV